MRPLPLVVLLSLVLLVPASPAAAAKSSIRVGLADQSPAMFDSPHFKALKIKRTRYFVRSDVMQNRTERAKARAFAKAAKKNKVSVLLHISTTNLSAKKGKVPSTRTYRRNAGRIVAYFRKLGVRDFGAWNEVNHKTQPTWNKIGHAVSFYKSMYRAVRKRCKRCAIVGLDILDQSGSDRYIRSFYKRLSRTWRKRLTVVGIHNYSDINRNRSRGTSKIIRTVRRYNKRTKFWFTETGALASFGRSFPYDEQRQAKRMKNMFKYAKRYRKSGVGRVYSYNWHGIERESYNCGTTCRFDAGLVDPLTLQPRPVYDVFKSQIKNFKR